MPNFAQAVKAEIIRLSRKEVKGQVSPLKSAVFALKLDVAALKRRVAQLEASNKRMAAQLGEVREKATEISPEAASKARLTARSVRALRNKLGLSQENFGALIGVTGQSVLAMEKKQGRLKCRQATLAKLLALRGIGKREARQRLAEIGAAA